MRLVAKSLKTIVTRIYLQDYNVTSEAGFLSFVPLFFRLFSVFIIYKNL
jgi:hypothetical protein